MLNDLKNSGIKDVLFFCVDGLPGFKDAIQFHLHQNLLEAVRNTVNSIVPVDVKIPKDYGTPPQTAGSNDIETGKKNLR